jgi:hypothetical protein
MYVWPLISECKMQNILKIFKSTWQLRIYSFAFNLSIPVQSPSIEQIAAEKTDHIR